MSTPFLVNVGTHEYPLYVQPYKVMAIHENDEGQTEVCLDDEAGSNFDGVRGTPHEVAKRLLDAMALVDKELQP